MDKAPLGSFGFRVSLGGGDLSLFQEVSGLGVQINVKDQPEGGMNFSSHKVLDNATFNDVTLKRGLIGPEMFSWINDVVAGNIQRRAVKIEVLDDKGNKTQQYDKLKTVNAELHALSDEYMRFRNASRISLASKRILHGWPDFRTRNLSKR